jgi:hypothetical protein
MFLIKPKKAPSFRLAKLGLFMSLFGIQKIAKRRLLQQQEQ